MNRKNSLINQKMICRILGFLLFIEGVMLLVCAGVSLFYHESDYIYFVYSTLITVGAGGLLVFLGRKAENKLTRRDGYCIVAFTWILFSAFGMLPFLISGAIPSVADAFFALDRWFGNRVLYHSRIAYLWSRESGALLGRGNGCDPR